MFVIEWRTVQPLFQTWRWYKFSTTTDCACKILPSYNCEDSGISTEMTASRWGGLHIPINLPSAWVMARSRGAKHSLLWACIMELVMDFYVQKLFGSIHAHVFVEAFSTCSTNSMVYLIPDSGPSAQIQWLPIGNYSWSESERGPCIGGQKQSGRCGRVGLRYLNVSLTVEYNMHTSTARKKSCTLEGAVYCDRVTSNSDIGGHKL